MPAYAQGMSAIRAAIATRLAAISGIGHVHTNPKHIREMPNTAAWKAQHVKNGKVNSCILMRERPGTGSAFVGYSHKRYRRHEFKIQFFYGMDLEGGSFDAFDALIDAVLENFRTGDSTLGSTCHTISYPEAREQGVIPSFCGVACHTITVYFSAEEVL